MQIPESISKLTTDVTPTSFTQNNQTPPIPIDDIILLFKRSLTTQQLASIEKGLAFLQTNTSTDKQIIKNFINLLNEIVNQAITGSEINEDLKSQIKSNTKQLINGVSTTVEYLYNILFSLNKDKNLLDVKDITFIILGYAIGTLKKVCNGRD
jgi:hypothetical protein